MTYRGLYSMMIIPVFRVLDVSDFSTVTARFAVVSTTLLVEEGWF